MKYNKNETMRLIGNQPILFNGCETPEERELLENQVKDIIEANAFNEDNLKGGIYNYIFSIVNDAFLLGKIYGIRAERSKNHKRASN